MGERYNEEEEMRKIISYECRKKKRLIIKSKSILNVKKLTTTKKLLVHIIINVIVLAILPLLLVIMHVLMGEKRIEFALCPANFSVSRIHIILLSNFVHLSWEHICGNILGYTIAVILWILPFLISQFTRQPERKVGSLLHRAQLLAVPRYWLYLVLNILAASLGSSYAWIYFKVSHCTLGFSSIVASLYGFSFYYWAKFLGIYYDDSTLQLTYAYLAVLLFLLLFAEIMELAIWKILLRLVIFILIIIFLLRLKQCIHRSSETLQNVTSKHAIYKLLKLFPFFSSVFFLIIITLFSFKTLFPINWLEQRVNILTHYVGMFTGLGLSFLITILESLNLLYLKIFRKIKTLLTQCRAS